MRFYGQDTSQTKLNRNITLLSILLFIFYTISVVIAYKSPATNYEASIYWSTPIICWISILALFFFASSCIITGASQKQFHRKIFILFLIISFLLPSTIHIIRGYYSWGMTVDPATHLGFLHMIIQTGHCSSYDLFYPGLHIFTAEIFELSRIDTRLLLLHVPILFSLLSLGGVYLLCRSILGSQDESNIAFILSCALLTGSITLFTPNAIGNAFVPIIVYAIIETYKRQSFTLSILLIIFCLSIVILYVLSAIAILIILLSLGLPAFLCNIIHDRKFDPSLLCLSKFVPVIVAMIIIWLVYWLSFFRTWRILALNIELFVDGVSSLAHVTSTTEIINYTGYFGYNIIEIFWRIYGPTVVVIFLIAISLIYMWNKQAINRESKMVFSLYGPITCYTVVCGALFLCEFNFGPLRFLPYIIILAPIVIGWFLVSWKGTNSIRHRESFKNVCIVLLVSGLYIGCLLNHYPSPYILQPNYQDTRAELDGAKWFFENRDATYAISGITFAPGRYAKALLTEEQKEKNDLPNYLRSNLDLSFAASRAENSIAFQAPYHFGYHESSSIVHYYDYETYLVTLERDFVYYDEQFVNLANERWHPADFYQLNYDNGLNLIYSNRGFQLWGINPIIRINPPPL